MFPAPVGDSEPRVSSGGRLCSAGGFPVTTACAWEMGVRVWLQQAHGSSRAKIQAQSGTNVWASQARARAHSGNGVRTQALSGITPLPIARTRAHTGA